MLVLFSLSFPALAGSTNITTTIPADHTVTVACGDGGGIMVGGVRYTETNGFTVARFGSFTLTAVPDPGYTTASITSNSSAGMTLTANGVILPRVCGDVTLTVTFEPDNTPAATSYIAVPVTGDQESIKARASVTNGTADVTVDGKALDNMLEKDTEANNVTVDVSGLGGKVNTVAIPTSTVKTVAEKAADPESGVKNLEIVTDTARVTFDEPALQEVSVQAVGSKVTLKVEIIEETRLQPAQQQVVAGAPENSLIVSVTLHSGGKQISDFGAGNATVRLPYTSAEGEDTGTITVWHVSQSGKLESLECRYAGGFVEFTTGHFSDYIVKPGKILTKCPFTDVGEDDWFHDDALYAYCNGIMTGISDRRFAPDSAATRAMVVTALYRLSGSPQASGSSGFKDVPKDKWYSDAVIWGAKNGIAAGYDDQTFHPNAPVTRQQLAAFMYRYAQLIGADVPQSASLARFRDSGQISGWARESIGWAVSTGLLKGSETAALNPLNAAARAEMAAVFHRYCLNIP